MVCRNEMVSLITGRIMVADVNSVVAGMPAVEL
jgi:hypothetical protein